MLSCCCSWCFHPVSIFLIHSVNPLLTYYLLPPNTWAFLSNLFPPHFPIQTLCGSSRFCSSSFCVFRADLWHGSREGRGELPPLCHQNCRQLTNYSPTWAGLDRRLPSKRRKRSPDFQVDCKGTEFQTGKKEIFPFHGSCTFVNHSGM